MSLSGTAQDQENRSNHLRPVGPSSLPAQEQQHGEQRKRRRRRNSDANNNNQQHQPSSSSSSSSSNNKHNNDNNNHNNNNQSVKNNNGDANRSNNRRRARPRRTFVTKPRSGRPGRPKHAAFLELFYGTTLYVTCIYLPSFPRYVYQSYLWGAARANLLRERVLWSVWICWRFSLAVLERLGWIEDPYRVGREGRQGGPSNSAPASGIRRFGRRLGRYISSTSTASLWEEFNRQHRRGAAPSPPADAHYSWGFGRTASAHPSVLAVLHDVQVLLLLAVLLAVVRIWFVHMLVPEFLAPRRLEAMARSKSSHLLSSSSYQFGGVQGWDEAKERLGVRRESVSGRYIMDRREAGATGGNGWYKRTLMWLSYHWHRLRPSVRRALGHEPSARYNDIFQSTPSPASSSPYRRSNSVPDPASHLFSAPRRATATFRLLYTSASCASALALFRSAEFWPRAVLGTHPNASTRHCWELGGSFSALGFLDDDYDAKNAQLKYFFLAQAAYQLHSLCFHAVSMLLLLFYGGGADGGDNHGAGSWAGRWISRFQRGTPNGRPRKGDAASQRRRREQVESTRLISMKTSMQSYVRPMMEHVLVLALLVGAYLFSGLRRLGAVGIFTLELSSVSLQLLQVAIYSPEDSRWRRPEVVLFVHRMLTVPMFVYCRLIVMPLILWRSALFESQEWLEQIAKVFSPGWAEKLYAMFNGSLCLIFALNLVLFRRLLFHPHLKQIRKQMKKQMRKHRG